MKVQYFAATTFIWLVSWTAALDIPYEDLNNPNNEADDDSETTIPLPDYDMFNTTASSMEMDTSDLNEGVIKRTDTNLVCTNKFVVNGRTLEHCYGDEHCRSYGDCCRDSAFYDESEQSATMSRFGCYNVPETDLVVKVVGRCPSWAYATAHQLANKRLCETNGGGSDEELTIGAYPATGTSSNRTYRNAYCAKCNGEPNVVYWKPIFRCRPPPAATQLPDRYARLENASDQHLLYHKRRWYYVDYENEVIYSCSIQLSADVPVTPLRHCPSDGLLVNDCPTGSNVGPVAEMCRSSANEVYEFNATGTGRTFRNAACALCNNVSIARLTCVPKPSLKTSNPSIKQLFDVKLQPCAPDEIYDVSAAKCRSIMRESGACSVSFKLSPGEFDGSSFTNDTVYVYAYKKRLKFALTNSTDILVCVDSLELLGSQETVYEAYLSYVSVIGSALSVLSLVAHLSLFAADAEPKNLPEKNLASMCLSLLLGYISWLSIAVAVPTGGTLCVVSALVMQFSFLASFAWMSVMATDVWIVLYASTKKLRLVGGKRNKRFAAYSAFAWLTPAAFTAFAASLQLSSAVSGFLPQLKPNFQHTCWFRNPQSLIALFVLPAGVTIVTNSVTFISAIRLIVASANGVSFAADTAVNRSRKNMKIYARLWLMMGLTWAIGLVAALCDDDVVWALYTVLNSLQGAFIFLAFDYSYSALRLLLPKLAVYSETQSSGVTPLSAST